MSRRTTGSIAPLLLATCCFWSCGEGRDRTSGYSDPGVFNGRGSAAPNFVLPRFSGDPVELSLTLAENELVLVNFWATWCSPCMIELPMLDRLYRKYRHDGFELLAVNLDSRREVAEGYLAKKDYIFPVLYDGSQSVQARYGVDSLPTSILIGPEGQVIEIFRGYSPILEYQLETMLQRLSSGP